MKISSLLAALAASTFASMALAQIPADQPAARTDQNSLTAHSQLLDKAKKGGIDIYFEGDSITRRWGATDYPELLANWRQNFFGWNAGRTSDGAPTRSRTFCGVFKTENSTA